MAHLFNNKYRIPSARLRNWDYASEGMYFVTICTKNRKNYFGEIIESNGDILLKPTEIGQIASSEWYKTIEMRPDMNLEFGEFVVMPNHIHGIIIIGANNFNRTDGMPPVSNDGMRKDEMDKDRMDKNGMRKDRMDNDGMDKDGMRKDGMHPVSKFAPQSKNLASIIRGYKSAVTTFARKNNIEFDWQPRYYDHIIRTMDAYNRISHYIINNPTKWHQDKFFG